MNSQPSVEEIMAQAQRIQEELQKTQQRLEKTVVTGTAGSDLVKIEMTGRFAVQKVAIDQSLLSESKNILEDFIAAAINDAVVQVETINQESVQSMMGNQNENLADSIKPRLS